MVLLQFFVYFEYEALDFAFRASEKMKKQNSPRTAKVYMYFRVSLEAFFLLHRIGVLYNLAQI